MANEENKIVDGETEPITPEEQIKLDAKKRQEDAVKYQEERMEKVVIFAREKLLPFLKEKNKSIDESKRIVESLAIVINQGLFQLMTTTTVKDLDLPSKINSNYPEAEEFLALIAGMENDNMQDTVESLQWMGQKIDAEIKKENKTRLFNELGIDF